MSRRRLSAVSAVVVLAVVVFGLSKAADKHAASGDQSAQSGGSSLTVMTDPTVMTGLTPAAMKSKNTISAWYRYYHTVWAQRFPHLKINEIEVPDDNTMVTKTLLGVNAGNPPDLIALHDQLPELVARHAVENLDKYYAAAGLTPQSFLAPFADYLRYNGHWYGFPGASFPTVSNVVYIPKFMQAAGIKQLPTTWNGLLQASEKVVKFDSQGRLTRIGLTIPSDPGEFLLDANLYCGRQVGWDPATRTFHANDPCMKAYYAYNKRLIDVYGGYAKYTRFISGDPSHWTCAKKAYVPTGKILFYIGAYWDGGQMDTCYKVSWELGPPPTPDGTDAEWRGLPPVAWVLAIPRGAKHPQTAFDFAKFTIYDHGDLAGPTTNGYVSQSQANSWAGYVLRSEARLRKQIGAPGNPMADAMPLVLKGTAIGKGTYATTPVETAYGQQMARAWQQVATGQQSVDAALNAVQADIAAQMKLQPSTIG